MRGAAVLNLALWAVFAAFVFSVIFDFHTRVAAIDFMAAQYQRRITGKPLETIEHGFRPLVRQAARLLRQHLVPLLQAHGVGERRARRLAYGGEAGEAAARLRGGAAGPEVEDETSEHVARAGGTRRSRPHRVEVGRERGAGGAHGADGDDAAVGVVGENVAVLVEVGGVAVLGRVRVHGRIGDGRGATAVQSSNLSAEMNAS